MKISVIIILSILIIGCENGNNQNMPIGPLKDYALNFKACDFTDCVPFGLAPVPDDVLEVLRNRKIDKEFIIYNSLIAAKLYRQQIEKAGQSYEINKSHPVWIAFEKYSGIEFSSEFETSIIIYGWLSESEYASDILLKTEFEAIDKKYKYIDAQVN